ncbi:hypothetical protein SDC9_114827 [bioreactor metagenome]|uniref:Uncharacterized protein n=1 Tax=bioreactor metagenome TaxID=1076179 RepID=A0A645BRQ6_9ZZZZ
MVEDSRCRACGRGDDLPFRAAIPGDAGAGLDTGTLLLNGDVVPVREH